MNELKKQHTCFSWNKAQALVQDISEGEEPEGLLLLPARHQSQQQSEFLLSNCVIRSNQNKRFMWITTKRLFNKVLIGTHKSSQTLHTGPLTLKKVPHLMFIISLVKQHLPFTFNWAEVHLLELKLRPTLIPKCDGHIQCSTVQHSSKSRNQQLKGNLIFVSTSASSWAET